MPNKRDLNLSEYNISKYAYHELFAFCLQYPEKKRQLVNTRNALGCQQYSDMPHGSTVGNPTEQAAIKAIKLSADTELIEHTAFEVDSGLYQWLLLAVTEDVPYKFLKSLKSIPYYEKGFYKARRKFFYLLAKKKGMI